MVDYITNVTDVDPETLPRISISEHQTITRCTQQWDYAYRQGLEQISPPSYLSRGSYLHALQEQFWYALYEDREFKLADAGGCAEAKLLEERGSVVDEKDRSEVLSLMAQWIRAQDLEGVRVAEVDGVPGIELKFFADIGLRNMQDERVLLHGFIDLVTIKDGELVLHDHKTASRAWSQLQVQMSQQPPAYTHALGTLTGIFANTFRYNFFFKDKFSYQNIHISEPHRLQMVEELQRSVYLRDSGSVVRGVHWSCSSCPFKELCATELQGLDSSLLRETTYAVNEEKVERYADD